MKRLFDLPTTHTPLADHGQAHLTNMTLSAVYPLLTTLVLFGLAILPAEILAQTNRAVARDDIFLTTVNENVPIGDVVLNDTVAAASLTFTRPANGTVSRRNGTNSYIYVPRRGFVGEDVFGYRARTAAGSLSAKVKVVVSADIETTGWREMFPKAKGICLGGGRRFRVNTLSAFGPNARTLALFDVTNGNQLNGEIENPGSPYVAKLHGAAVAAATRGKGRVVVVPVSAFFTNFSVADADKATPGGKRQLVTNIVNWLGQTNAAQRRLLKIVTIHPAVADALDGKTINKRGELIEDPKNPGLGFEQVVRAYSAFKLDVRVDEEKLMQALPEADVFVGAIQKVVPVPTKASPAHVGVSNPKILQALEQLVSRGGGLWVGSNQMDLINPILRDAGLALGRDQSGGRAPLTANIPLQWSGAFDDIFAAIDAYWGFYGRFPVEKYGAGGVTKFYVDYYGNSDTSGFTGPRDASFVPDTARQEDPVISAASLIRGHLWAMAQALPRHDTCRAQFNQYLPKLDCAEIPSIKYFPEVRAQMAVALAQLENENNLITPVDQLQKSRVVDRLLGGAVPDDMSRVQNYPVQLQWQDYDLQPLGLHAVPGEVVEIDFSGEAMALVDKGYSIFVNPPMEHLSSVQDPALNQPAQLEREFALTSENLHHGKLRVGSAYGGALFLSRDRTTDGAANAALKTWAAEQKLLSPRKYFETHSYFAQRMGLKGVAPSLTVRVNGGAVEMPYFKLGVHTNEDWPAMMQRPGYYTILEIPQGRYYWILPTQELQLWEFKDIEQVMVRTWIAVEQVMMPMGLDQGLVRVPFSVSYLYIDRPGGESINPSNSLLGMKLGRSRTDCNTLMPGCNSAGSPINYHKVGHVFEGVLGICPFGNQRQIHQYTDWLKPGIGEMVGAENSYWAFYKSLPSERDGKRGIKPGCLLNMFYQAPYGDRDGSQVMRRVNADLATDYYKTFDRDRATEPKLPLAYATPENFLNPDVADKYIQYIYDHSGYDVAPVFAALGVQIAPRTLKKMIGIPKWAPLISTHYKSAPVASPDGRPVQFDLLGQTGFSVVQPQATASANQAAGKTAKSLTITSVGGVRPFLRSNFDFKTFRDAGLTLKHVNTTSQYGGKITQVSPGVFKYTPQAGFTGRDWFTYTAVHPETHNAAKFSVCIAVKVNADPTVSQQRNFAQIEQKVGRGFLEQILTTSRDDKTGHVAKEYVNPFNTLYVNATAVRRGAGNQSLIARGYLEITPENAGTYTFWISTAYSNTTVKLSYQGDTTDPAQAKTIIQVKPQDNPGGKRNIREEQVVDFFHRQWRRENTSKPIALQAHADGSPRRYYIEVSKRPGSKVPKGMPVFDKLSLGWSKGSIEVADTPQQIIPARMVIPYDIPRAPLPQNDVAKAQSGRPVVIDVLANDRDYTLANPADRSNLKIFSVVGSGRGKVEIIKDGTAVQYTPDPGFTGIDHLWYIVKQRDNRQGDLLTHARVDVTVGRATR